MQAEQRRLADENSGHAPVRESGRSSKLSQSVEILGQMNNVVTVIAGNAQILAQQHDPKQARQLRQFLRQYKELTACLWEMLAREDRRE